MKHEHRKRWSHDPPHRERPEQWSGQPTGLFIWFAFMFGLMILLLLGGIAAVFFLFSTAIAPEPNTAVVLPLSVCGLILIIPLLMRLIGGRAFAGVGTVADVMNAAEKVAGGDLSARVPVHNRRRRGRFARLAQSFNHMTAELQKADEQRRNLTADVAHELRTPLHIIQGNLEGVLDGVYEPTPAHIQATLDETHALARLVDDLHTLAQAEAGQLPLHWAVVDVADLLTDVQTSFSGQAEAKGVELAVDLAPKPAALTVHGDAGRLDQVLGNLVANALRHTPAGGQIQLAAAGANGRVRIQVRDTGEGIPADELPHIFDRFWRSDRARTRTGSGGGLGLAIAKQLVTAHHGRIEVSSAPGRGTVVTVELPTEPDPL